MEYSILETIADRRNTISVPSINRKDVSGSLLTDFSPFSVSTNSTYFVLRKGISLDYLEQIFSKLRKKEIVQSIRGTQGGYVLNKNPRQKKLSEIFLALDENVKTTVCEKHSKKGCNGRSTKCITHYLWDELDIHINTFFENKNLEDLIRS